MFPRTRFQPPKHDDDDRREKNKWYVPLRVIADAEPELAVALRSSSITCDRGEKNVNVSVKTQEGWAGCTARDRILRRDFR